MQMQRISIFEGLQKLRKVFAKAKTKHPIPKTELSSKVM